MPDPIVSLNEESLKADLRELVRRTVEAQVRRRERVGLEALPGRDAAGGVATPEGGPMGLSESAQES